jgi:hypothetical protein
MGRNREDRSIDEWTTFGDKFVALVKGKELKRSISDNLENLLTADRGLQEIVLQDLNGYKDNESTKGIWTKWVKRLNTAKDDKKKKKMDCSIEAAAIVDRIKIQFNFTNTIQAMDYIIKAFPLGLRAQLHNFARKNRDFLNEVYRDEINSWEIESNHEISWLDGYCDHDVVPSIPSFDELVLNMISDLSEQYTKMINENKRLEASLYKIEKDNRALKLVIENSKRREGLILNKMEEYLASILISPADNEGYRIISQKEYDETSLKGKVNRLKTLYSELGLEFPPKLTLK